MPSTKNKKSLGKKQGKNSVDNKLGKRLKNSVSNSLRNISHKDNFGNSNWIKFINMENSKLDPSILTINRSFNQQPKLPLMKSVRANINTHRSKTQPSQQVEITNFVALDCEMVGVGHKGSQSVLARVSLVNSSGECIYDKYVKPTAQVTDYRTFVSGIRPHHLADGEDFFKVQKEVADILKGRTLVGHALKHDLQVLFLHHPRKLIRDTITFMKFRNETSGTLSLKNLARKFLNVNIQTGEHDSVEDARAAMQLYMTYRKEWEQERRQKFSTTKGVKKNFAPVCVTADYV